MNIFEKNWDHGKENQSVKEDPNDIFRKAEEIERIILANRTNEKEKEGYYEIFRNFFLAHGAMETIDWQGELLRISQGNGKILVRRENPEKIMELFEGKGTFSVGSSEYGEQPNAAMLGGDLSGLRIALAGGFGKVGKGSIALTIGFNPSPDLHVGDLPSGQYTHFTGVDRGLTKIVSGKVPLENVKFVMMRVLKNVFPEKYMTEKEIDNEKDMYIQRMFILNPKKEPNS